MTTIPVIWLCRDHPETGGTMRRGWWDQSLLGDMLDGKLGRFPHGLEFGHIEAGDLVTWVQPPLGGAVVVLPGRFHADPEGVAWVQAQIDMLPWVVLVITSDEESLMPWWELDHPAMRLWVMTPRPMLSPNALDLDRLPFWIGEGYGPRTREALATYHAEQDTRPIDVGFSGQITHQRRTEMWDALRSLMDGGGETVHADWTPGFTQGMDRVNYSDMLACSKLAPAPAGPATPDSFRFYEALEAGCLPLADAFTPERWEGYWDLVYGGTDFAEVIPVVHDWSQLPAAMPSLLADYPANANRAGAWWCQTKRGMIQRMADDIAAVSRDGRLEDEMDLADLITVVMPTSPIPSHPSTDIIEETLQSVRDRLPDCLVLIACDGVREEQAERRPDYDEYVRRIVWKCQHEWTNVVPIVADEHRHQALMTKLAMEQVRTPMLLFVEHDTPLCGEIPFSDLANFIASGDANVVRLHHESEILPSQEHLMLDRHPSVMWGEESQPFAAIRTAQWSQRPHLAASQFYRNVLRNYFGDQSRTMIEDCLYGIINGYWREEGVRGWERFRLWLYAPSTPAEEGGMQRSDHLDGRGSDPMYPMRYEYPDGGPGPEHAPRATSHRED